MVMSLATRPAIGPSSVPSSDQTKPPALIQLLPFFVRATVGAFCSSGGGRRGGGAGGGAGSGGGEKAPAPRRAVRACLPHAGGETRRRRRGRRRGEGPG